MPKTYVEIDFFQMEKGNNTSSKPSSPERDPTSFRGIQSVVSKINPQLLKMVMAAGHTRSSDDIAARPTPANPASPLPLFNSAYASRCSPPPATTGTAPLTIFYNGTVTTFDVPRDKAEAIMKMAETGVVGNPAEKPKDSVIHGKQLEGDMPIARRKSLQSFLEKRKERFVSVSPYRMANPYRPC